MGFIIHRVRQTFVTALFVLGIGSTTVLYFSYSQELSSSRSSESTARSSNPKKSPTAPTEEPIENESPTEGKQVTLTGIVTVPP